MSWPDMKALALLSLAWILAAPSGAAQAQAQAMPPELYLDAGHGGTDLGVQFAGTNEAVVALEIAKELQAALKEQGIPVQLSREDSAADLSPSRRVSAANASGAKAFISIHINHSPSAFARGPRLFVPKEIPAPADPSAPPRWEAAAGLKAPAARKLGQELAKALTTSVAQKVSVQSLNLALFRGLILPGVVVELGFASHAETLEMLKDPAYRKDLALRLAKGWIAYAGEPAAAVPAAPATQGQP